MSEHKIQSVSTSPAVSGFAITPIDTVDLEHPTRGIYVGVSGDLKVTLVNGETITFTSLAAGVIHPIAASRVYDTDTDATGILGVY